MSNNTASITIPVKTFNALSTGSLCEIDTMTLAAGSDPRVAIDPVANKIVVTGNGSASSPGLDLVFAVTVDGAGGGSYNIAGIVFGGATQSSNVFTGQTGDNSGTVTVTDVLTTLGQWEFFVIVQKGSGGIIGLIDPPIENDVEAR